jgi:hypothetical protein
VDADATVPRDSLLTTVVLRHLALARVKNVEPPLPAGAADARVAAHVAAWRADQRRWR